MINNAIKYFVMDMLDMILLMLRYAPLMLMGIAVMILLWIQVREFKKG